jgi:uncharacterized protein YqeY
MNLFEQISSDIKTAMLAKDKVRLEALRNVKKFFLEAKTAPGANDTLSDEDALKIIQKLVKQGKDSAQIYTEQNRPELAAVEIEQVRTMESYLPKQVLRDKKTWAKSWELQQNHYQANPKVAPSRML